MIGRLGIKYNLLGNYNTEDRILDKSSAWFFKERRGQVTVGMILVLITMILVAGLVARALINTSGAMGTQVTTTSEKATSRVSTYLRIIGVIGYTTYNETESPSGSNITKIIITTRLFSESDAVRYNDIILSYQSGDIYISGIFFNDSVTPAASVTEVDITTDNDIKDFEIVRLKDIIPDDTLDPGETIDIHFWIEDNNGVDWQLEANKRFTMTIHPSNGEIITVKKTAPNTITSKYVTGWS